jgi:hypothetical protein
MKRRALRLWLYRQRVGLVLRLSERRKIHGLLVVVTTVGTDVEPELAFRRVREALDLIAAHDPRCLSRMRRDLNVIWVRRHPLCRASHDPLLGACVIDLPNFVASDRFSAAEIAASIVHEATHARLKRAGVVYSAATAARIERICRKAELRFGRRLPDNGAAVVERARGALEVLERDPGEALSVAELRELQRRQAEIIVEHVRVPRWMRFLRRKVRR